MGEIKGKGRPKGGSTDEQLSEVIAELKEGRKLDDIALERPALYCKNFMGLTKIAVRIEKSKPAVDMCRKNIWLWGPTKQGKSTFASMNYPGRFSYTKDGGYFGSYVDQKYALFDDFVYAKEKGFDWKQFLRMTWMQACEVPQKYGVPVAWNVEVNIFTASVNLETAFARKLEPEDGDIDQGLSRFWVVHVHDKVMKQLFLAVTPKEFCDERIARYPYQEYTGPTWSQVMENLFEKYKDKVEVPFRNEKTVEGSTYYYQMEYGLWHRYWRNEQPTPEPQNE